MSGGNIIADALAGKGRLLSWKTIFTALQEQNPPHSNIELLDTIFFSDDEFFSLSRPDNIHPKPDASTRTRLDTLTSAVNIDQTNSKFPPIKDIKDETVKLAQTLGVSEPSALRIVVLDYEGRDEVGLLKASSVPDIGEMEGVWSGKESMLRMSELKSDKEIESETLIRRLSLYLLDRRYALKVAAFLVRASVSTADDSIVVWKQLGQKYVDKAVKVDGGLAIVKSAVEGLQTRLLAKASSYPKWLEEQVEQHGEQILYEWEKQLLTEAIHILELLFILFYATIPPSAKIMKVWMTFMSDTTFLGEVDNFKLANAAEIAKLLNYLVPLASVVTLKLLAVDVLSPNFFENWRTDSDDEEEIYIKSASATKLINATLLNMPKDSYISLPAFAWALVVQRMRLFSRKLALESDTRLITQGNEDTDSLMNTLMRIPAGRMTRIIESDTPNGLQALSIAAEDSIRYLWHAIDGLCSPGPGFWLGMAEDSEKMKEVVSTLVSNTIPVVDFDGPMLMGSILVHDGSTVVDKVPAYIKRFWNDPVVAMKIKEEALLRFPFEPMPYLQVARAMSVDPNAVHRFLTEATTFTHALPRGFRDYEMDAEDAFRLQLASDLQLLMPRLDGMGEDESSGVVVRMGTMGRIISESPTAQIVAWHFEYSPLAFLGRMLELKLGNRAEYGGFVPEIADQCWDIEQCTEVVAIFDTLIRTIAKTVGPSETFEQAARILGEASDVLSRNKDVVSIILDLMEDELQGAIHSSQSDMIKSTDFVVNALKLSSILLKILPNRIWPFLARSSLLERHGRGGALNGMLSSVEVIRAEFDFTLAALELFDGLVEEALYTSVSALTVTTPNASKTPQRSLVVLSESGPSKGTHAGVTKSVQRDIIAEFTRWSVGVFESYRSWKYKSMLQKHEIGNRISKTFTTILNAVYGVGELNKVDEKITGVLAPAAEHIVRVFLSETSSTLSHGPLVGTIEDGVATPESSLYVAPLFAYIEHTKSIMHLADTLVRTRMYLKLPQSSLEARLCDDSPSIAKLFAVNQLYRSSSIRLLATLVSAYNFGAAPNEEPPSLLGHLGAECANYLVRLISDVEIPSTDLEIRIWKFISAILSNRQQGMSILLLKGETASVGGFGSKEKETRKPPKSILKTAIDALVDISSLSSTRALAMLETVVLAQNFWSLAMDDLGKHPKLFDSLIDYIGSFSNEPSTGDSDELTEQKANKFATLAYIAELMALYLHSKLSKSREPAFVQKLVNKSSYFFKNGYKVTGYRASLHGFLKDNISAKWPALDLADLRKTWLRTRIFGTQYLYDLELAEKILGFHSSWKQNDKGFKRELESANANLSLIESQVGLLRAWKLLALELCDVLPHHKAMEADLLSVVLNCLKANTDSESLPGPIFVKIIDERAVFGFLLMRKLQQQYKVENYRLYSDLLPSVWKAIYSSRHALEASFRSGDLGHFRPLLRTFYTALIMLPTEKDALDASVPGIVGDTLALVVAKGFKELSTAVLHASPSAQPEDLALLTAILQAALHLPGQDSMHFTIASHFLENETIRTAVTLFSWSHQLTPSDPVYGELAILFLLELSTSTVLAEQVAGQNALTQLIATDLAQQIAATHDLTPLSNPRLHAIWARGILPLMLNLLTACGRRVAQDVRTTLEFFRPVIAQITGRWPRPTYITTLQIRELLNLSILSKVLGDLPGWNSDEIANGVEYLLQHKKILASSVVPITEEEEGEVVVKDGERVTDKGLVEKAVKALEEVGQVLGEEAGHTL